MNRVEPAGTFTREEGGAEAMIRTSPAPVRGLLSLVDRLDHAETGLPIADLFAAASTSALAFFFGIVT
jgi:hypothetical protein